MGVSICLKEVIGSSKKRKITLKTFKLIYKSWEKYVGDANPLHVRAGIQREPDWLQAKVEDRLLLRLQIPQVRSHARRRPLSQLPHQPRSGQETTAKAPRRKTVQN